MFQVLPFPITFPTDLQWQPVGNIQPSSGALHHGKNPKQREMKELHDYQCTEFKDLRCLPKNFFFWKGIHFSLSPVTTPGAHQVLRMHGPLKENTAWSPFTWGTILPKNIAGSLIVWRTLAALVTTQWFKPQISVGIQTCCLLIDTLKHPQTLPKIKVPERSSWSLY